jgi:hypothetical protein
VYRITEPVCLEPSSSRSWGPVAIGQSKALASRGKVQIVTKSRHVRDGAAHSSPPSRVGPRPCSLAAGSDLRAE